MRPVPPASLGLRLSVLKLPRFDKDKPFRYLGRRVVQALAEAATTNMLLGRRSAPGRYLVVRIVEDAAEKEEWEQQYSESAGAIQREMDREAAAREIRLRSKAELDVVVLTRTEAEAGEAERVLAAALDVDDVGPAHARLIEERELVLPRRVRTLLLESDPPEAQAYVDDQPVGVTPCRVEDIPEGAHRLIFSRPGCLPFEDTLRVEPGRPGQKLTYRAALVAEPDMGWLEVRTFPPRARVTAAGETRDSPARWRIPAGPAEVRIELEDFAPMTLAVEVPPAPEELPHRVQVRLDYAGPFRDEVVGRLVVYKPGTYGPPRSVRPDEPAGNRISSFFREADPLGAGEWEDSGRRLVADPDPEILGEKPLRRGVLIIGREDPGSLVHPDIRLFDPENTVSRGCHAWLYVYADTSTGAAYNTFLIGNNSPAGIRVDGALVMETRRLADDAEIEIGSFRMRVIKELPEARVDF